MTDTPPPSPDRDKPFATVKLLEDWTHPWTQMVYRAGIALDIDQTTFVLMRDDRHPALMDPEMRVHPLRNATTLTFSVPAMPNWIKRRFVDPDPLEFYHQEDGEWVLLGKPFEPQKVQIPHTEAEWREPDEAKHSTQTSESDPPNGAR